MDFSKLKNLMDHFTSWRIPGCSCIVYKDHIPVFNYSSGFSDVNRQLKMDPEKDLLFMYSCSKPVTCVAALILYEEGKYELNEPVSKYIPEFKEMFIENNGTLTKAKNQITIGNLFEMTSGLDYNTNRPHFLAAQKELLPECNTVEMIKELAKDPILFEPGEKWNYGMSHDVIGALVEVISGFSLKDFANERIFKPLGMNNTQYGMSKLSINNFAKQYQFFDEENKYKEIDTSNYYLFGTDYYSGGAGVISTVSDMAIFTDMLANKGKGKNGARILAPTTIDLMSTNRLNKKQREPFDWDALKGYGYGLGVRTLMYPCIAGSPSPVGEFGWTGAAGAYMLVDTTNKIALYYSHHMLNNQEYYTVPRLRNVLYSCLD